jgi:CRISPR-associated endoribonuclease Cas6
MAVSILYTSCLFRLRLSGKDAVSQFLEATIRGGFGYTLRGLVCAAGKSTCSGCMLRHNCAYSFLFETPPPANAPRLAKYRAVPHPFTMHAIQTGDVLHLHLTLFGQATRYLVWFIYTLNKLGERGLGKNKMLFKVEEVTSEGQKIYPIDNDQVGTIATNDRIVLEPGKPMQGKISLEFLSPLVLRTKGMIHSKFAAYSFMANLLRRVTNLNAFYGENPEAVTDPKPYLDTVKSLSVKSAMKPVGRSRYSTRQKQEIDYSGIIGSVSLAGEIGILMPLLKAGEVMGVGKNTAFGFGRYKILKEGNTET